MIFFKRFPIFLLIGEQVISIPEVHLNPCNHEEADTRIVIHVQDAVQRGATNILVRTVDTDVVIILISCFSILINIQPSLQIVVAFGMGRSFQTLSVNTIYNNLGEHKSRALPFSMLFLDATPHLLSTELAKRLLGRLGIHTRTSLMLLFISTTIPLSPLFFHLQNSSC